jgi:hypothetical protein
MWSQAKETTMKASIKRLVAVREATAAGFTVLGVATRDRRWIRALTPEPNPSQCVLFRVGARKWHYFDWHNEATGSGRDPRRAICGGLGEVIDTNSQLRSYKSQILTAPEWYRVNCAGLYRESTTVFNS